MELIVFDLDGTLLDASSVVSEHTGETLEKLRDRGIAYTVATGRTLHAARDLLTGHGFALPHIYKNGVMIWHPRDGSYSHCSLLTEQEVSSVLQAFESAEVTPFIFTLEAQSDHVVYHGPLRNEGEHRLTKMFAKDRGLTVLDITQMPPDSDITNISALGSPEAIAQVQVAVDGQMHLVAYSGVALDEHSRWMDVHHSAASKGGAIEQLKQDLGFSRVICFGDSDNDLSMFEMADECYAPANAKGPLLTAATEVIGHHDEDGISRFLRERFEL